MHDHSSYTSGTYRGNPMNRARRLRSILCRSLLTLATLSVASAQNAVPFEAKLQTILQRPEFAHATFGIEFYSLEGNHPVYRWNADKLMVPGSTTKLLTEGTLLNLLGADYQFHTRVYRTGEIKKGVLQGDIVIVASGDPNLSGRIQTDNTLAYENMDHSYGGPESHGLGDPLLVIKQFAQQVAAKGIRKINGRILVDTRLFPEGERELGTNVVLSPIVVNDNVIDVVATGGATEGVPVQIQVSPKTSYLQIINQATTAKADSKPDLNYTGEKTNSDGTHSVILSGTLPAGKGSEMMAYPVPEPSQFAAAVFKEALAAIGVEIKSEAKGSAPDFKALSVHYTPDKLVAEHVSPPLKEEVKITLKVSQNLHASTAPYLLGALVAKKDKEIDQAGF